jgi:homoserine/homoserine lactone efflux protein
MSLELYLAYLAACLVITLVPGPTVALIIANGLTHGTRAGLANVAGTQAGLAVIVGIIAVGLASLVETMGVWFDWLRLVGAAYLVWLGWKLLRAPDAMSEPGRAPRPRGGFFLQGFLVMLGNPKALLFLGAFIPQFVDPTGDQVGQALLLGATAMACAALTDGAYALITGRAGKLLTRARIRFVSRLSGLCLIGGGAWLAFSRAK